MHSISGSQLTVNSDPPRTPKRVMLPSCLHQHPEHHLNGMASSRLELALCPASREVNLVTWEVRANNILDREVPQAPGEHDLGCPGQHIGQAREISSPFLSARPHVHK